MPLAMAALDVAGAIRERSPTDMALFGEPAGRFADRFLVPDAGLGLLARAVSDGNAEAEAWLLTAAGQRRFQVSLWRQRGGERIRVLAAFAACEPQPDICGEASASLRRAVAELGADLRAPIEAVSAFAGRLRSEALAANSGAAAEHAADIIAAAWRIRRLADDLLGVAASEDGLRPHLRGEIDVARLVRRIARLAGPSAVAAGVRIGLEGLPKPGSGPLILGDEGLLWGAIEMILGNAIRHGGQGSSIRFSLSPNDGGQVLEIADTGPGIDSEGLAPSLREGGELASCGETLRKIGADLAIDGSPDTGLTARIVFPAARCLDPV